MRVGYALPESHSDGIDEADTQASWGEPENSSQVQPDLRRSSRTSKQPARFNDFVVGSSKLYGLEKYVTYANLSRSNFCFSTTLNKTTEPTTYDEAIRKIQNGYESMNNDIGALT
ncbi:hypothetical protein Tco_1302974 [Tanacetum coccineum]